MLRCRKYSNGSGSGNRGQQEEVMNESKSAEFNAADITALSHLYRGEMYRSTVWRTRLDATTNWQS